MTLPSCFAVDLTQSITPANLDDVWRRVLIVSSGWQMSVADIPDTEPAMRFFKAASISGRRKRRKIIKKKKMIM